MKAKMFQFNITYLHKKKIIIINNIKINVNFENFSEDDAFTFINSNF